MRCNRVPPEQINLPCSTFSRGKCSNFGANNWFDYVEANAAALGIPNYQQYTRRVFIFPKDLNCSGADAA